jgi:hypothetical protein
MKTILAVALVSAAVISTSAYAQTAQPTRSGRTVRGNSTGFGKNGSNGS